MSGMLCSISLNLSDLSVHRSSEETSGFSHVESSREAKTREEVNGGPQRHRRRLTCTGQEGHRHDTTWTEVLMEVGVSCVSLPGGVQAGLNSKYRVSMPECAQQNTNRQ